MPALKFILPALACALFCVTDVYAQNLVLKDGNRVSESEFKVADGKINRTITLSNGQKGQASLAFTDIERLEWPEVKPLIEAQALLSQGKGKEAVTVLQAGKEYFKPFKAIKGNPYNEVAFAYVEALDQAGDFDGLLKALPEVETMKWDDAKKLKLRIIKLNMERRTSSDQEAVLAQAKDLLSETDDSAVSARLWMTIAEIHLKKERWEDALMAYLQVPVFFGSQTSLVPVAELMAARTLTKMERFEDAVAFYQRISEAYPGSDTADKAKKELLTINGLKNKPDTFSQAAKNSEKKPESK